MKSTELQNHAPYIPTTDCPALNTSITANTSKDKDEPPSAQRTGTGMTSAGIIANNRAKILFDTGADICFISASFAARAGLKTIPTDTRGATCADGRTARIFGRVVVRLKLKQHTSRFDCAVLQMTPALDVILGRDWLTQQRALIDCFSSRITLHGSTHRATIPLHDTPQRGEPVTSESPDTSSCTMLCFVSRDTVHSSDTLHSVPCDISEVLDEFRDVVRDADTLPGPPPDRPDLPPVIPLKPGAEPIARPMYRISQLERAELERQLKEGLTLGLIEPSSSPWSAPVLFVKKKTGELRMVLDWRALNALTIKNACATSDVQSLIDQIGDKRVFSVCDALSAYHQVGLNPEDRPKTAFRTHLGHYQYTVLGFGLVNSPAVWTTCIQNVLRDLIGKDCLVHMDDIIIMSTTKANHADAVRRVLSRLRTHKIYLKARKCKWALEEVEFLGYHISANGIRASDTKTKALTEWPRPTNVATLRSFNGLATYFRKFIQGFSKMMQPLTNLTKKTVAFDWSPDCDKAFQAVKAALSSPPVLALPQLGPDAPPFSVVSDASGFALGACLMQAGHPVAYESRTMIPAERNYSTGEQELLAVVHAFKVWRPYLECGRTVTVVTDHRPNIYLPTQTLMSRRKARWYRHKPISLAAHNKVSRDIAGRTPEAPS